MKNKMGICEWVFAVNGPAAIKHAAEIGFDGIQLGDLGGSKNCFPMNDRKIQKDYLETAGRYNIELHSLHLFTLVREGTLKCLLSTPEGKHAVNSIQKGLEACEALRIPALLVTSYDACNINNDYDLENTAKMLQIACKMGKEHGVRIVYESVTPGKKVKEILDYVGKDLKLCYDILNPIKFMKGDPAEEMRLIGAGPIDHVHVKDAPYELTGFCQLGEGRGRYKESMEVLKEIGYSGWYITENFYHTPPMGLKGSIFELAEKDLETMRGMVD